ncbi:hypothetical protein CYMTET_52796 [Cymbomonas tetramitiformis]|uniref:Uncharacterized protein n=1 Tax=Cymbomonas tetramitiformis TaxID=36881 RepID=A0AAE0BIA9_9CHLO|nr:hypothetical protein CYMTET_52796 [Cymbomonas tetramitiformis]
MEVGSGSAEMEHEADGAGEGEAGGAIRPLGGTLGGVGGLRAMGQARRQPMAGGLKGDPEGLGEAGWAWLRGLSIDECAVSDYPPLMVPKRMRGLFTECAMVALRRMRVDTEDVDAYKLFFLLPCLILQPVQKGEKKGVAQVIKERCACFLRGDWEELHAEAPGDRRATAEADEERVLRDAVRLVKAGQLGKAAKRLELAKLAPATETLQKLERLHPAGTGRRREVGEDRRRELQAQALELDEGVFDVDAAREEAVDGGMGGFFVGRWFSVVKWDEVRKWKGCKIVSWSDNESARLVTENLWGKATFIPLLKEILLLTPKHDLRIVTRRISSKANGLADALSRSEMGRFFELLREWSRRDSPRDLDDWMVNEWLWEKARVFGPFAVDACCDKMGANSRCFCWWSIVDSCLSKQWRGLNVYCNPPFSLLFEILTHFLSKKRVAPRTTSAVFVLPFWPTERFWLEIVVPAIDCGLFQVVEFVPEGSEVFTSPNGVRGRRKDCGPARWPVVLVRVCRAYSLVESQVAGSAEGG